MRTTVLCVLAIQFYVCNFPLAFFRRIANSFTHTLATHTHTHMPHTNSTHTHSHWQFCCVHLFISFHFALCLCATVQQSFLRHKFISVCVCVCMHNNRQLIWCDLYAYALCNWVAYLMGTRGCPKWISMGILSRRLGSLPPPPLSYLPWGLYWF